MNEELLLMDAISKSSPILLNGGLKIRGPNALFDFIYSVWLEKALMTARMIPALFEAERVNHLKQKKLLEEVGRKGTFTDTYGWSENKEFLISFSISRPLYHYFTNVIGPFLGVGKAFWDDENSRAWKRIKRMILDGDKLRIAKFARDIEKKLMKESGKSIVCIPCGTTTMVGKE